LATERPSPPPLTACIRHSAYLAVVCWCPCCPRPGPSRPANVAPGPRALCSPASGPWAGLGSQGGAPSGNMSPPPLMDTGR